MVRGDAPTLAMLLDGENLRLFFQVIVGGDAQFGCGGGFVEIRIEFLAHEVETGPSEKDLLMDIRDALKAKS